MTQERTLTEPLRQREGTSRETRGSASLVPESAPIIERTVRDMLESTRRLGARMVAVDDENRPAGSGHDFIG